MCAQNGNWFHKMFVLKGPCFITVGKKVVLKKVQMHTKKTSALSTDYGNINNVFRSQ